MNSPAESATVTRQSRAERLAQRKARYAELWDHFGLGPEAIARLTQRQIEELCYHPRDKTTGAIKRPAARAPELTEEQHVATYLRVVSQSGRKPPPEVVRAMVAKIREAHQAKRERTSERTSDAI